MRWYYSFLIIIVIFSLNCPAFPWGGYGHSHITAAAVEDLPLSMETIFHPVKQWLADTSTDRGIRTGWAPNETYFHYIDADIDTACPYPFTKLPRTLSEYTAKYDIKEGIAPYEVAILTVTLSSAYRDWHQNPTGSNFTTCMYWMTRVAHYLEDLHQPLHTTKNFNPNGVHALYETNMLNTFTPEVASKLGSGAIYQPNPLEFAFSIISISHPYCGAICSADTAAHKADPKDGNLYYTLLWSSTQSFTTTLLNLGGVSVASIWYTAWVNAGIETTAPQDMPAKKD